MSVRRLTAPAVSNGGSKTSPNENPAGDAPAGLLTRVMFSALALTLLLAGVALLTGGTLLLIAGGSPYYACAGVAAIAAAGLLHFRRPLGVTVYALTVLLTIPWALWEVGLDGWALLPRLVAPAVFLVLLAPLLTQLRSRPGIKAAVVSASATGAALLVLAGAVALANGHPPLESRPAASPAAVASQDASDWPEVGGAPAGARHSPAGQITPANVSQLEVAWTFHTGDVVGDRPGFAAFEATPIKLGDSLYLCTPHDIVIALDPASGRQRWRYDPKDNPAWTGFSKCRGVTYYKSLADADGLCAERIAVGTADFRLISLDARTGRPCRRFGANGVLDLGRGMGRLPPGSVTVTSPAVFTGGVLVLGHFVMDNQRADAPPGVVRAFDADTGALRWAWDIGRPGVHTEPPPGQTYALGTPNAWTTFAADEALGLVYVPTGNPGDDYFGAGRSAESERYGSALVALDSKTGRPVWAFQTVHHDLWDYDLAAQPALVEFPTAQGQVPAIIQATKGGQIFVLDRRNGRPLVPVSERPVPRVGAPGERPSPTQPFSAMPLLGGPDLSEKDAWGVTPLDQLLCRIEFRRSYYLGRYTPWSLRPTLLSPGYAGGVDWGGVSVDPERGLLVVNTTRLATRGWLIPHGKKTVAAQGDPGVETAQVAPYPMKGTPYAAFTGPWLSVLRTPCQRPPWGVLTAIDLKSRRVVWERALGDASAVGPLGIASRLPIRIGTPNNGGPLSTAGGVTFIAAGLDNKLRAFDTKTGREIWQARLPAGGQAGPSSYISGGRQYVVVAAGGHQIMHTKPGDSVVAFRLRGE